MVHFLWEEYKGVPLWLWIVLVLTIVLLFAVINFAAVLRQPCIDACAGNPVQTCYTDRVVCVGKQEIYVKMINR